MIFCLFTSSLFAFFFQRVGFERFGEDFLIFFVSVSTVPHSEKDHNNISGLRYLVLCRVLIDRMFVTSKHRNVFPDITDEILRSFDAVYCPSREEFRVLNAEHVLPEFIIQCRWISSKTKDSV